MVNDGLLTELLYHLRLTAWRNLKVKVIEFGRHDNTCNSCNTITMVDTKIEPVRRLLTYLQFTNKERRQI